MLGSTRRRKHGEKGDILPTRGSSDISKYNRSKRRRRRQLKKYLPLLVAGTVLLAIVFSIMSLASSSASSPFRRLANALTFSSSSASYSMSSTGRQGCNNVNIHAVVKHEPNPPIICINDPHLMPKSWRYLEEEEGLVFSDPGGPWTAEEQALADEAVNEGLEELISFFEQASPNKIRGLGTDAVNSVFDYVISSQNMPHFHQRALKIAVQVFKISVQPYIPEFARDKGEEISETELKTELKAATDCKDMFAKTTLSGYAHRLAKEDSTDKELQQMRNALVSNLNKSIQACNGKLDLMFSDGVTGEDAEEPWREAIQNKEQHADEVYEWNMWTVALTNALTIPDLVLPKETEEYIASVWKYAAEYNIPSYIDYNDEDAEENPRGSFKTMAYLATHLQFIPTGYGRHYSYVQDASYLYHYCRENFYAAMNIGGHDLIAEFIDMIMAYGCSVENDYQLRHGMRYMLDLYKKANHTFINHLEEWEQKQFEKEHKHKKNVKVKNARSLSDYSLIHKPWTGIAALETKACFEPEVPGSYGHAFRKAIASMPSSTSLSASSSSASADASEDD